jgi:hypothetical protein
LQDALEKLFPNDAWKTFVTGTIINSPHMQALMKSAGKYPAYIPAKNFVSAIIDQIGTDKFNAADFSAATIDASALPGDMKNVLKTLLAKAQNNLVVFQKELETFYNDAMDRAGGWYKRKMRTIMLFVAAAIAIALNIDTIKIAQDSLKSTDGLSKTVDNITSEMSKVNFKNDTFRITDNNNKEIVTVQSRLDTTAVTTKTDSAASSINTSKQNIKTLRLIYEQNTGYTLGYNDKFCDEWKGLNILKKLLGILITVFAQQLGANYWFDTLNKVINIRAAGKKPDDSKSA